MIKDAQNVVRQEQKFLVPFSELSSVLQLYKAKQEYPGRHINSLYFDTSNFRHFFDGEEGIVPRSKYRYRWYGDAPIEQSDGAFETKITKEFYKEKFSKSYSFKTIKELISDVRSLYSHDLRPKFTVSYDRIYFKGMGDIRFTYDFNITGKNFETSISTQYFENIFEIKYRGFDSGQIAPRLLDKQVRFSKYNLIVQKLIDP